MTWPLSARCRPTVEPRATQYIDTMRVMIERLVARGVAYVAEDHVLFSPSAMDALPWAPRYGTLAHRPLDEMLAGARVDVAPYKRDPMDFVLWKPSKPNEPGWPSPAGIAAPGRPGWHIECSAMSMATLLEPFGGGLECDDPSRNIFDIHGGGIDLVFPHHENEIAQSCCAFESSRMANVWMHNGFLQVEGEKMSKSLGNFVTIHELLHTTKFGGRAWPGEVLRLAMLRTHYRQPIDWTVRELERADQKLSEWYRLIRGAASSVGSVDEGVLDALSDDLNTHDAIVRLQELARTGKRPALAASLRFLGFSCDLSKLDWAVSTGHDGLSINIDSTAPSARTVIGEARGTSTSTATAVGRWFKFEADGSYSADPVTQKRIDVLISLRTAARAAKNWAESDRLRDQLTALGVAIKDNKDGTTLGAKAMSTVSLRPYLPADARRCAEIFRSSIDELAAEDYDEEQREAWASRADDEQAFGARLSEALTLLAVIDGAVAGFASLKGADEIDMLFVEPEFARQGAASALVEALTKLAQARGAKRLTTEASDVARPLFERQGFTAQKRNLVRVGDQWLANTTMTKTLGAESTPPTRH